MAYLIDVTQLIYGVIYFNSRGYTYRTFTYMYRVTRNFRGSNFCELIRGVSNFGEN